MSAAASIMFGGEDQPGMVDLKVRGAIHDRGAGALKGAIGSIDTTIKDLELGPDDDVVRPPALRRASRSSKSRSTASGRPR